MGRLRKFGALCAVCAAVVGFVGAAPGSAAPSAKVLADDLSSPKGIAVTDRGDPVVGQGAFGAPGPVLLYRQQGPNRGTAEELTEPLNLVDIAISPLDGTGWGIGSNDLTLYHEQANGTIVAVLDIAAYQATDPDPVDQDDFPEESNPYGLTVLPNGDALVADAAGNDIIRVTPAGDAVTVARFDLELVATDHLPPEFGTFPPFITAEAVPTSVTVGPDGAIYVGQLMGFPFRPGTSKVWRIDADAVGAWCSVSQPSDDCTVYQSGFTAIQDIAFSPNTGRLYVYELAAEGVLAFEEGLNTGVFPDAVLIEVKANKRTELAAGQLSQPGGVVVANNNMVYVTDQVFTGGRLLRVVG